MKICAMFLPQFHADPFNDEWWGEGFTEWDNVRSAHALIDGQIQPRVPLEGYFDLSQSQEIERQAKQAKQFGISAFTFYDYWYDGKSPLRKPLQLFLQNSQIDIEFSLCWANHSWTKSWTNRSGALDVLISQKYPEDRTSREKHFEHLAKAFCDPRYIKHEGRPILQIYDSAIVPTSYIEAMREYFKNKHGFEIHIDAIISAWLANWRWLELYDSCTLFQPSAALFSPTNMYGEQKHRLSLETIVRAAPVAIKRLAYLFLDRLPDKVKAFDYETTLTNLLNQYIISNKTCPLPMNAMTFVDFDNTPRYGKRARIMTGYQTSIFEGHLRALIQASAKFNGLGYVFVNAWNEWGEGAHLQPDAVLKFERLQAIENALRRV
jgi:hypothetical protein